MRRDQTQAVRRASAARKDDAQPLKRLPRRATKLTHERLLRALSDRRIKRAFGAFS